MPESHALLGASSSKQWLNCPPSARLQEKIPNESSVYAEEGTYAHSVCEYKVRKYLHERVKRPQSEEYDSEEIEQMRWRRWYRHIDQHKLENNRLY